MDLTTYPPPRLRLQQGWRWIWFVGVMAIDAMAGLSAKDFLTVAEVLALPDEVVARRSRRTPSRPLRGTRRAFSRLLD